MKNNKREGFGRKFNDFWLPLIVTNGTLDVEKIKNELADWDYVMEQVSKVYDHITNGKLSKLIYSAETIIREHDDSCHKYCVDADDAKYELSQARKEEREKCRKILNSGKRMYEIGKEEARKERDEEWRERIEKLIYIWTDKDKEKINKEYLNFSYYAAMVDLNNIVLQDLLDKKE